MALPKLDGEVGGRMASSSSFPLVDKKLPSASFPLASNSYDWILQDSRAKASTSVSSSVSPPSSDLSSADTSLPKMDSNFSQNSSDSSVRPPSSSLAMLGSRGVQAYYKHLDRFEALERSKSVGNLSKSGRPTILKPLKLWRPGADGKKRMLWVYGNPWEGGPRYLRTHSGHMSRIPDKPEPENLASRLGEEEERRDWAIDVPSPPPRVPLPPALATKREALQKRPPRIKPLSVPAPHRRPPKERPIPAAEEKLERGVEGGEARIKLYSKLKKIERRRFSVDVLARDRGEEPTKDRGHDGREDDEKEEDESQNTFGSTRLPSEDDEDEDDDDTDLDREEAIVESDISGLQSVTEPNTRSETAEADRRAGKEMLKEEEQNEEAEEDREDGEKKETKGEELNIKERAMDKKKEEENVEEGHEQEQDEDTHNTQKKEQVTKEETKKLKKTEKKENKVKKREKATELVKRNDQKEKGKNGKVLSKSSKKEQKSDDEEGRSEKETLKESADENKHIDYSSTKDDLNKEKRADLEDSEKEKKSRDNEELEIREEDKSKQKPEEAAKMNTEEDSKEKDEEKDNDKESGFSSSSVKDTEDESSTEITDIKHSKPLSDIDPKEETAEEGAKTEGDKEKERTTTNDSDFGEENFSDDDDAALEGDLHLSDASINEDEIAVSNPDVLNHFGDKMIKSPVPETEEKEEDPVDGEGPVLRAVTFADTVNEIVSRLNTKAVIEEGTKEEKPKEFAAFNWKPNVTFFQFGLEEEAPKASIGSSSEGAKVFSFAGGPPAPPFPVKQRRGASLPRGSGGFGGGNAKGWERLRRVSGRDRGRRRDRSV